MNLRRASFLLAAVVATGAGLTACSSGGSNAPAATGSAAGSPVATSVGSPTAASGSPQSTTSAPSTGSSTTAAATSSPSQKASAAASKTASSGSGGANSGSFTVPAIAGENVADGTGTYTKLGTGRVEVHVCVTQTGKAFAVGIQAFAYNSAGQSKQIGAVVQTGPGQSACGTLVLLLYTAHLKVHTFIGQGGNIIKTSPVLTVY